MDNIINFENQIQEYSTSLPDIVLTEFQDSDAESIVELLGNDTEIHKNLRYLPQPYTLKDANDYIQWSKGLKKEHKKTFNFAIKNKKTGQLLGSCGFVPSDPSSIGYWIGQKYWGKGIGTVVVQTLLHIGFNDYHYSKISAIVFDWNIPSHKVLLKNGFQKEKLIKNYIEKDGQSLDAIEFIKT
eukprot:jgi/Orpsp1_1/1192110/evm.model.d7180000090686.1